MSAAMLPITALLIAAAFLTGSIWWIVAGIGIWVLDLALS